MLAFLFFLGLASTIAACLSPWQCYALLHDHKSHSHDPNHLPLNWVFLATKAAFEQHWAFLLSFLRSFLRAVQSTQATLPPEMSLSIFTADSGRSTTAAALIDDVAAKRNTVLDLKKKLKGHKSEEENLTADLRSNIMNKTDLGHDILDLRAFVKDDPNDKKAKRKLAKLEAKLQVQLQLAMNKRTGLKAVIAATEEDLICAETALRTAVEAKLAYRRQLLSDDSSGGESSDEESDSVGNDDATFGIGGNR